MGYICSWPRVYPFVRPALLLLVLGISYSNASAQDGNYTVEVCPDALWKDAIFLRGPSSGEIFGNVTKWTQEQLKTYVTKTVVPQVRPNLAFVALALVSLLVFLLWRLFRRCCMCCCMRQSCEKQRSQADPKKVLSGCGYWLQKIILLVFALAALAMLLAGIIMAPKDLFVKMWGPINRMTSYLNETTVDMDNLIDGLSGFNPILNDFVAIVNDVNLPLIRSKMQAVGTTLDSAAANPNTTVSALIALNDSMASFHSQAAVLQPQLSSSGLPLSLTTLQTGLPGLSTVVTSCQNYSTLLANLTAQFQALSAEAGPIYDTTSLMAAMNGVEVDFWSGELAKMLNALDTWIIFRTGSTLGNLATALSDLSSTIDTLKNPMIPNADAALQSFYNAWTNAITNLRALLDRLAYMQANVLLLDPASNATVTKLNNLYNNFTAFQALQPPPLGMAANLSALASELSLGSGVATLITKLNDAQTAIDAIQPTVLEDARSALGNLKTSLENLSPKHSATKSAITTYRNGQTQLNFNTMKTSVVATGNSLDLSIVAKTKADVAASNTSVMAVQVAAAGPLGQLATDIKTGAASVGSEMSASDAAIASCPSLTPYLSVTASFSSVYRGMSSPKSRELDSVSSTLSTVEDLLVSVPRTVQSKVASIQESFGSGVHKLQTEVIKKPDDFEKDHEHQVESFDLSRYRATCVLLAVAALAAVLLIVFVLVNCPWGIGCSIFFLLVLAALLFVLAVLFATVLVVAQDGCYHTEHIVLEAIGNDSSVKPLMDYYFFGSENVSVKSVLKAADLVDIDKVEQDVVDLASNMTSKFTAKYKPQTRLANNIQAVNDFATNTTKRIDVLVEVASVKSVRPIYMEVKAYPCCEITDYSIKLWVVLTFGGWLMFMSATMAMSYLGRLDQLPQSGCCGCKPLLGKNLNSKVHPDPEEGEDGAVQAIVIPPDEQTMQSQKAAQPAGGAWAPSAPPYPPPPQPPLYPPPPPATYPPQPYGAYPPPGPVTVNTRD